MDFLKHDYAEIFIKDGILYFTYLPIQNFDIQSAEKIVAARLGMQREQAYPILCDMRQMSFPDLKARKYLAIQGSLLVKAVAYLVNPNISDYMTRFFIEVNQPLVSTAVFITKNKAIHYLNQFK
ncbi:hypothetical protein ACFQ3R_00170 [Mesonia ostreae]|uniref:DUF7793 domain-containing protein n=1 Tax=Mesonia ostreae TaxID=861110 RepID=A0ABU2KJP5_9FLAO|nr:hypothetical protein [Mesonia ostreae]MDT0294894.1 hypothetical protein [Mesonia ostreae]